MLLEKSYFRGSEKQAIMIPMGESYECVVCGELSRTSSQNIPHEKDEQDSTGIVDSFSSDVRITEWRRMPYHPYTLNRIQIICLGVVVPCHKLSHHHNRPETLRAMKLITLIFNELCLHAHQACTCVTYAMPNFKIFLP